MRSLLRILAIGAIALSVQAAPVPDDEGIEVNVDRRGAKIIVDMQFSIAATPLEAWPVRTDYEHIAAFVSNLKSSVVLRRNDNTLEVEQSGEAKRGLLAYPFETVRAVELVPFEEIRSTLVKGKFKSYSFTAGIVDDGTAVSVIKHGEYEATTWVPPIVGPALIEAETRKQ